ncbi:MAG TPA: M23 family metallopeptidase [Jatrophihabitans sp.]|nr:M23 family metallopeptidase [Jatrophihabitans sp.]
MSRRPSAVGRDSVSGRSLAVGRASVTGSYRAPVAGPVRVLRPFTAPASRYGPGHRGVDLALAPAGAVRSAAAGRVSFAGSVAGRGVVVVLHPGGISTEYEPVTPLVSAGQVVDGGQVLGRLAGRHRGCPAAGCLHWGARRAGVYLDPLTLLRPLGVVRLLPWDGPPG